MVVTRRQRLLGKFGYGRPPERAEVPIAKKPEAISEQEYKNRYYEQQAVRQEATRLQAIQQTRDKIKDLERRQTELKKEQKFEAADTLQKQMVVETQYIRNLKEAARYTSTGRYIWTPSIAREQIIPAREFEMISAVRTDIRKPAEAKEVEKMVKAGYTPIYKPFGAGKKLVGFEMRMTPVGKVTKATEIERYKTAGYTTSEATALATWSMEHKQTPTPKLARTIIAKAEFQAAAERYVPPKEVSAPPVRTFAEQQLYKLQQERAKLFTEQYRVIKETPIETLEREIKGAYIGFGLSILQTEAFLQSLFTKPIETIKGIPSSLKSTAEFIGGGALAQTIRQESGLVTGYVAGELVQLKLSQKLFKAAGTQLERLRARISPKYVSLQDDVIKLTSQTGKDIRLTISPPVSKITEPLRIQVRVAGKRVTAIHAARDFFDDIFTRTVRVDKKIAAGAPPLERALFADPYGRIRIGRLGLEVADEAKLLDLLSGDVSFKRVKPQVLLFEDVGVAKFPKHLKSIEWKLKTGRTLTAAEQAKLLRWQLKVTGEFKPVGFLTREPEITLAPSEIVKKVDVPAVTIIGGRRVSIIRTDITTATKRTSQLMKKAALTSKEISELTSRLTVETRFDVSSIITSKKYISPYRLGISATVGLSKYATPSKSSIMGLSKGISKPIRRLPIRKRIARKPIRKIPYYPYLYAPTVPSMFRLPPRKRRRPPVKRRLYRPPVRRRVYYPRMIPPLLIPPILPERKLKEPSIKKKVKEDVALVEGFTSRVLKLKPLMIKKADLPKIAARFKAGLALRPKPIVLPDILPRRKKKYKKKKSIKRKRKK